LEPVVLDSSRQERLYVLVYGPREGTAGRIFPPPGQALASNHVAASGTWVLPFDFAVGPKAIVAMVATGEWPNLVFNTPRAQLVDLLPMNNHIKLLRR
jgi:hypothetical protein